MTRLSDDAKAIFEAAVGAVEADALLGAMDVERIASRSLDSYGNVFVVALGKAALAMASVLESYGFPIAAGCVVVPPGYPASLPGKFTMPTAVRIMEGGHPIPDDGSRRAALRVLEIAERAKRDDLVIVLISGGGSALCADFLHGVTLDDARATYHLLLESGADIHAMNAVRKHISRIGGGRFAAAAYPAEVVSLIVSDVVGDDVSVIAGGPTAADPTTYEDARDVLEETDLWEAVPFSVRAAIQAGIEDPSLETPKPESRIFERVANRLIGTNLTALEAGRAAAVSMGYSARIETRELTGEARDVGRMIAAQLYDRPGDYTCLLSGGETTVTVRGDGRGGRNQELALAAGIELAASEMEAVVLSGGTDGIDGPTDAAGAWVTSRTVGAARQLGLDPPAYLKNNDSYTFFSRVGSLLRTGHTHTNVMDVVVCLK
ncbi:MAG: glycerate kinase, partial [Rhodothermales bacterium]